MIIALWGHTLTLALKNMLLTSACYRAKSMYVYDGNLYNICIYKLVHKYILFDFEKLLNGQGHFPPEKFRNLFCGK